MQEEVESRRSPQKAKVQDRAHCQKWKERGAMPKKPPKGNEAAMSVQRVKENGRRREAVAGKLTGT